MNHFIYDTQKRAYVGRPYTSLEKALDKHYDLAFDYNKANDATDGSHVYHVYIAPDWMNAKDVTAHLINRLFDPSLPNHVTRVIMCTIGTAPLTEKTSKEILEQNI